MSSPPSPTNRPPNAMKLAGKGMELVGGILVFTLLGYWLEQKYESLRPWGLIVGAVLGIVGGLYNLVRQDLLRMVQPDESCPKQVADEDADEREADS